MNFRNDIARGGRVLNELFKITGQVGFAEKVAKLNSLLVDEDLIDMLALAEGGD